MGETERLPRRSEGAEEDIKAEVGRWQMERNLKRDTGRVGKGMNI